MTRREKVRLIRAFEVAYELAYRRGFHHGFVAHGDGEMGLTEAGVADWRSSPVRSRETPPHWPRRWPSGWFSCRMIDRMMSESREHGDVIRDFVQSAPVQRDRKFP